ncbi:electron transport complex subunit RsxG [Buchnera aphidicola]|uniref:Ion-translocating oxidoreductase complex subunit G n=2 Tax=Buchnera aphidicola TaxID=9 RepID=A0A5J6ZD43_9GAMM|nr:electron transport complex subunit RsxG [Buchnera aphidicola]QFQ31963.1 electron transport complex subunit RsxG [Buchnera aphidicola (Aphis gossypii)]UPT14493.1 electron transport complex subunit RsxG [Buchnera aphidicola (Aphis gossypii)]
MKDFKKILKNSFIMSFFSVLSLCIVIYVNYITKNQIKKQKEQEKKIFIQQVVPHNIYSLYEEKKYLVDSEWLGDSNKHNLWLLFRNKIAKIAIVESTAPDGYSGSIYILVAAYLNGKIIGVRVLSHKETPGIGDKIDISVSDWITKFKDLMVKNEKDNHVLLKKYGGQIDQFTGATITPQAVTNAIKRTVIFIKKIPLILSLKR